MDIIYIDGLSQVQEGQLSKYTNVVKGWQYRWFILDPKTGKLSYFLVNNLFLLFMFKNSILY